MNLNTSPVPKDDDEDFERGYPKDIYIPYAECVGSFVKVLGWVIDNCGLLYFICFVEARVFIAVDLFSQSVFEIKIRKGSWDLVFCSEAMFLFVLVLF